MLFFLSRRKVFLKSDEQQIISRFQKHPELMLHILICHNENILSGNLYCGDSVLALPSCILCMILDIS